MIEIIYYSLMANQDDIFYKTLDNADWKLLLDNFEIYEPRNVKKFVNEFKGIVDYLALGSSFLSKIQDDSKVKKAYKMSKWGLFYLLFKKKRME